MQGFDSAWQMGCQMVECDVRPSRDRVLVLAHDAHVTDKYGTSFLVSDTLAHDLAALDLGAGEGVPALQTLADWAMQTGCAVMADMKCEGDGTEAAVIAALSGLPPHQKIVPGAVRGSRDLFRTLDPDLPLSLSLDKNAPDLQTDAAFDALLAHLDTRAVTWQWPTLTPYRVARLHAENVQVFAWTVDDAEQIRRLADMGVNGIISNHADLLSAL